MQTIKLTKDEIVILYVAARYLKDFDQSIIDRNLANDRDILQSEIDGLALLESILSNPVKHGRT